MEPIFRMLAIAQTPADMERYVDAARATPQLRLGLMARDPAHRRDGVEDLIRTALARHAPHNLTLISNAYPVPGSQLLHLTALGLKELSSAGGGGCLRRAFGASTHSVQEALLAERMGAEYITLSPLFPTASKPGITGGGLELLAEVCAAVAVPVFALGGVTLANAASCIAAGAYGVAGIALFAQNNIEELHEAMQVAEQHSSPN
ncbi:MAG: thiamine phosphate synthase [Chlorobi bacterium]|nr:thiamine phosphate synthase [Chlorobiota bacterium]